jgi:hypothetical protein
MEKNGSEVRLRVQSEGGHKSSGAMTKIEEMPDAAGFVIYALTS